MKPFRASRITFSDTTSFRVKIFFFFYYYDWRNNSLSARNLGSRPKQPPLTLLRNCFALRKSQCCLGFFLFPMYAWASCVIAVYSCRLLPNRERQVGRLLPLFVLVCYFCGRYFLFLREIRFNVIVGSRRRAHAHVGFCFFKLGLLGRVLTSHFTRFQTFLAGRYKWA